MAKSKYVDTSAVINVLANIYMNPALLDETDYTFSGDDFATNDFHQTLFTAIFNLHSLGAKEIKVNTIVDYLESRPKRKAIFELNKGIEYLNALEDQANPDTFRYYYSRLKKMTLLRMYEQKCGMDLSWFYDADNILDSKKKQIQEDRLDNTSLTEIADLIDKKIEEVKIAYVDACASITAHAADGIEKLLDDLHNKPDVGYPLYGKIMNTVTRGARLKKFYLRSGSTGTGKSRAMIGDACYIGCGFMFDKASSQWVNIGEPQSTLYIATEQDITEVQTMMLAFLSAVDEEKILTGDFVGDEEKRVLQAVRVLQNSKIYFETLPDFSLQDIENIIKKNIKDNNVLYVFYDYIHTSMKILEEITRRSGGVKLREDNILFMISVRLKDLCNQYGIFIMSSTQLNGQVNEAEMYDQNLLRGAKSIADKIDVGLILLEATDEDREKLAPLVRKMGVAMPNMKMSVYKNRRGRWKNVLVWLNADRSICRFDQAFITKYNYEYIDDYKLFDFNIKPAKELSAF